MLEGVKALFRFTMAILYLAFQVTPPSSCEVFTTIRNTAKEMYDIKLLLSIVEQIKLPKDSYFAIRRSFYMVQSSFNSDQFYMQSLSNDASRQLVSNKPLSVQQLPDTKPPAMSLISAASIVAHQSFGINSGNNDTCQAYNSNRNAFSGSGPFGPRVCTSSNRTKVCIQNIGKMGRSHIRIMDVNVRSNEKSLMSPLRNCLVIGISNCGKIIIFARQSSKKNFKTFREQDLLFHVHEVSTEIFDGYYLEDHSLAIILTHLGEIFKIDTTKCFIDSQVGSTETLILRDSHSIGEYDKVKLRLASMDQLTNLLWIYIECEDTTKPQVNSSNKPLTSDSTRSPRYRSNNPFLFDNNEDGDLILQQQQANITESTAQVRPSYQRKILIIDIMTFDIFSAFSVHNNFGTITNFRTSLVAFCQISNPMSNQFSSRIVRIGPTGRYEHLLSFSDVVDFMITVPESTSNNNNKNSNKQQNDCDNMNNISQTQRYSTLKRLLTRSMSMVTNDESTYDDNNSADGIVAGKMQTLSPTNLTKYYRSLIKSQSTCVNESEISDPERYKKMLQSNVNSSSSNLSKTQESNLDNEQRIPIKTVAGATNVKSESKPTDKDHSSLPKALTENPSKAIITSYLGDVDDFMETNYMPVNMAFIFRNGKIALFEFTESYAIHTRESQLDRYDYSKIIEVNKNGQDFIITILTIYDKLIKVVI